MTDITDLKHVNTEDTYMIVKRDKPSFVKELNDKCLKYGVRDEPFQNAILAFSLLELLSINKTKFIIENIAYHTNSDEKQLIKLNLEEKTLQMYKNFPIQFYIQIATKNMESFLGIKPRINDHANMDHLYFKMVKVSDQEGGGKKSRKSVKKRRPSKKSRKSRRSRKSKK